MFSLAFQLRKIPQYYIVQIAVTIVNPRSKLEMIQFWLNICIFIVNDVRLHSMQVIRL